MRLLHLIAFWLLGMLPAFAALDVKNPRWGFGGKIVPGTFNVLSLEVRNTGNEIVTATLRLAPGETGGSSASSYQALTLSPGQSRWIQFTPYIAAYKPHFTLSWGEHADESLELADRPGEKNSGPPAVVILADPEFLREARLPVFPEELFPVTVSATDGLHAVILDHQPKFRGAVQADAFFDWVQLGGIVHLVPSASGARPVFDGKLAALNTAGDRARVGAGWVVKHSLPLAEITQAQLDQAQFPAPAEREASLENNNYGRYQNDAFADSSFFENMASVTRPHIAWWLIYLLTFVYVIIIGPVFFILRKRDYRLLLLGFLGTVALFAWIFTVIGRRGYGESQVCHSVAIARVLGGGRYDVTHWSHAFATTGHTYHLAYPGTSHLYAANSQRGDTVRGKITVGANAAFDADIPLFSFRNFIHRGVMTSDDITATAVSIPKSDPASNQTTWRDSFKMTLASEIPDEVIASAVQVGSYFLPAEIRGKEVRVKGFSSGNGIGTLVPDGSNYQSRNNYYYGGYGNSPETALAMMRNAGPPLAQRALGDLQNAKRGFGREPGKETLRLYIYAAAPRSFRLAGDQFSTGKNFVLYVQDFAIPSSTTPSTP